MSTAEIQLALEHVQFISKETFADWAAALPTLSSEERRSVKKDKKPITDTTTYLPNSTAHQLLSYGIEEWRKNYEFIRTATNNGKYLAERDKSSLWMSAPEDFRIFQKLFSDIHVRTIPLPRYSKKGFIRGCIVSPRLVPDELAEKLGLIDLEKYRSPKTGKVDRKSILEYYSQLEFTDALKIIFTAAKRIRPDNSRVKIIEPPDTDLIKKYAPNYSMPENAPGSIMYISQRSSSSAARARDTNGRRLRHREMSKVQIFDNAYAAVRKNEHIEVGYAKEVMKLSELRTELETYRTRLNQGWRKDTNKDEKENFIEEWKNISIKVHECLEGKVDKQKLDAFMALDIETSFKDSTGRTNVSAAMSRFTKAINRLAKRLTHTRYIGGYNKEDEALLFSEIKAQETAVLSFCNTIKRRAPLNLDRLALFNPSISLTPQEVATNHSGFMRNLLVVPHELKNVSMNPFRQIARDLVVNYRKLDAAVGERNLKETERLLNEITGAGTFLENLIQVEKEKLIETRKIAPASPLDFPTKDLSNFGTRIR